MSKRLLGVGGCGESGRTNIIEQKIPDKSYRSKEQSGRALN